MVSENIPATDYVSAASSVIAAMFGLVTVVTVIVAARQLPTEHRVYASGLSQQVLGPWHDKVRTRRLLGLQREINTLRITVPLLVKANWNPQFVFPGAPVSSAQDGQADQEKALAKASWVNFLAALDVKPRDHNLYHMSAQPNLVNDILPMRWEGKSLVAICSLLGFQSSEQKTSFEEPMKLPMQWTGPLVPDRISPEVHSFFRHIPQQTEGHGFVARLWRSINGMMIQDKKALYLGGTDDLSERRAKNRETEESLKGTNSNNSRSESSVQGSRETELLNVDRNLSTSPTVRTPQNSTAFHAPAVGLRGTEDNDMFEMLMKAPSREAIWKNFESPSDRGGKDELNYDEVASELGGSRDMLRRTREKRLGKMEVFMQRKGLLSGIIQGELVNSRGLSIQDCTEYSRTYVEYEDVDLKRTPHHLGDLFMDEELLKLMKQAVGFIRPDGFYFTPSEWLASDVSEVYRHVDQFCESPKNEEALFPTLKLQDWPKTCQSRESLHYAVLLCNDFQHVRLYRHPHFTVEDMVVISKVSKALPKVPDLVWCMLISPDLFKDLGRAFSRSIESLEVHGGWAFLDTEVSSSKGVLDCTDLMKSCGVLRNEDTSNHATVHPTPTDTDSMYYTVPLCLDGRFRGHEVLASFLDVLVTYLWVEKSWITNVESYDRGIPQTITMC
ncbi:hypothetical protein QBC40DRAFT_302794 [Triangularia verruculosa]|uniref:Uncharacterized protein n=1 Tax=Triangularia verruculosa TaxID=2587418 RepID=A0AAN7B097_9PEZI|nr:hypothetical protein QBC40DRAFT_302794 [Triangularia verruculosa]